MKYIYYGERSCRFHAPQIINGEVEEIALHRWLELRAIKHLTLEQEEELDNLYDEVNDIYYAADDLNAAEMLKELKEKGKTYAFGEETWLGIGKTQIDAKLEYLRGREEEYKG